MKIACHAKQTVHAPAASSDVEMADTSGAISKPDTSDAESKEKDKEKKKKEKSNYSTGTPHM